jgi:hypothetical protein
MKTNVRLARARKTVPIKNKVGMRKLIKVIIVIAVNQIFIDIYVLTQQDKTYITTEIITITRIIIILFFIYLRS